MFTAKLVWQPGPQQGIGEGNAYLRNCQQRLEILDREMYSAGPIVRGHTYKHLMAGLSAYFMMRTGLLWWPGSMLPIDPRCPFEDCGRDWEWAQIRRLTRANDYIGPGDGS